MDRYPITIIFGGAVLGRLDGEMIMSDQIVEQCLHPSSPLDSTVQSFCSAGVVVIGKLLMKGKIAKAERQEIINAD